MPTDQPYDWKKIIKIDESVPADKRESIELMLNQMANDPLGIKVFEGIEKRTDNNHVTIFTKAKDTDGQVMVSNLTFPGQQERMAAEFPTANGSNVLNLNFTDDKSAGFVDINTGKLVPWSENRVLFHELSHGSCQLIADLHAQKNLIKQEFDNLMLAVSDKADEQQNAISGYKAYEAVQSKIDDIKDPAKAKKAQKLFDADPKNATIKKQLDQISAASDAAFTAANEKYGPLLDNFNKQITDLRFAEERKAVDLENQYMAGFGEPARAYYKLWKDFKHPPEKAIVLQDKNDRLEKHFITTEKISQKDMDERIKKLEAEGEGIETYKKWEKEIEEAKKQLKGKGITMINGGHVESEHGDKSPLGTPILYPDGRSSGVC